MNHPDFLADVAQLVEHGTRNTEVMGSNPIVGFMKALATRQGFFVYRVCLWYRSLNY